MTETAEAGDVFQVSGWVHTLGGHVERRKALWARLGGFESRVLGDRLAAAAIDRPIYSTGLARSGTTILLEVVSRHPATVTHQYRDYPFLYTPYAWNWLLRYLETHPGRPVERAHGDRIMVTPASPEAMEEVLWMHFFPDGHRPETTNALGRETVNPAFETFYRDHIAKLLLARSGTRYLAKGNYNLTRLPYIAKIFPDAKFIIPVRDPESQIASLVKQQTLFHRGVATEPRARDHLRRVGHFEFGPDRRPINTGDGERARDVIELWQRGDEVRGWARYWAEIYDHVADLLAADPDLRSAALVVRYEDLCSRPAETLSRVFDHVALDDAAGLIAEWAGTIARPTYYSPNFSDAERAAIDEETRATAALFGYPD